MKFREKLDKDYGTVSDSDQLTDISSMQRAALILSQQQ